jgi:heptose I phosphotransferase
VILELDKNFRKTFVDQVKLFEQIMMLDGKVYRQLENRKTLRFSRDEKNYFIKQHFGVGWKEVFKNLLQLRLPIVSARNEWEAIRRLSELKIATAKLIGYGERGINPAKRQSFIITEELVGVDSLEDVCKAWQQQSPSFEFKLKLIEKVAKVARKLHEHGVNHRDFYLCHFMLERANVSESNIKLYLFDLHRAQIREETPKRWRIKDIAGLYFSSMDVGLTKRDVLRFLKYYFSGSLSETLQQRKDFLFETENRALKLYQKTKNREHKCCR